MNNDERDDRSAADDPSAAAGARHRAPSGPRRRAVQPDDRLTAIIPAVGDDTAPQLRDPIEAVKAALEGAPRERDQVLSGVTDTEVPITSSAPDVAPDSEPGPSERRAQPRPRRRRRTRWRSVRRVLYLGAAVLILLPIVTFAMAYVMVDVPKPGDIRTKQVSTILASDGSELAKIVPPEGNRIDVDLDQVPVYVRNAVIAAEDRTFYSNPGFSFSGFGRAVTNNLFGGDLQGGSTITQQYVKNALVGSDRTAVGGMIRKAKELVIATKMSQQWTKDDVLQAYLNIIYFGRGAWGIGAAAQAYFGKPVEELDVAEGALLATVINAPSDLDPAEHLTDATQRWNWVLDGMVTIGALTQADRDQQQFPEVVEDQVQTGTTGPDGLIERQVIAELLDLFHIDKETLYAEGLQITTTIDPKAQQAAEDAVTKYLDGEDADVRAAVVSVDPRSGAVRAYYGGTDANGYDYAQAGLQTGSAFKVFALVAALEQGMGLGYQVDSSPLTVDGVKITNVEGEGCGTCNIAEALKQSLNTSYYRLMLKLDNGPADVAAAAHEAGVATSFPGVPHTLSEDGQGGPPNNGIVLGQYQTRPIDMASAYATLAASGVYHRPHFVAKVVDADGNVIFDAATQDDAGEQRIDPAVADNVTAAMVPIPGYSRGHNLAGGRPSAAKTGTVQLGDTGDNKDAWMVGYTPSLSTAVWVGTDDNAPLTNSWGGPVYGSGLPSDIWKATMDGALQGTDNESFPKPGKVGGYAGVPAAPPPPPETAAPPSVTVIQPTIEIAPGVTIPVGPPSTVTNPPSPSEAGSPTPTP